MVVLWILFGISVFVIFFAMVGYPALLIIIDKLKKPAKIKKDPSLEPTVTYMIVAHNEEKVIEEKLKNSMELDYPKEKLEILVTSDNSTDGTNEIVRKFIEDTRDGHKMRLYVTKEHKGKTNAQNEAQRTVTSEILVMTDANTMVAKDAIRELVSCFTAEDIVYVCGKLVYTNGENATGHSESTYWNIDLRMRDIESRLQTITGGNGALYACRNSSYIEFEPILCHDGAMPSAYARQQKRALFNPQAIACEKAGEKDSDEFKRKVRMNRTILRTYKKLAEVLNVRKYRWYSLFYFGHRSCRYNLWLSHLIALISCLVLAILGSRVGMVFFVLQLLFFLIALISKGLKCRNKLFRMMWYYTFTVFAQYVAIYKSITGQTKAVWDKAESTR